MDDDGFEMGPIACLVACAIIAVVVTLEWLTRHRRGVLLTSGAAGFALALWLL